MITFTVSGLWHGASLNYVVWGMLNGALQVLEGFFGKGKKALSLPGRLGRMAGTFVLICCTWFFFRVHALSTGVKMIGRIFGSFAAPGVATGFSVGQAVVLAAAIALLLALDALHESGRRLTDMSRKWPFVVFGGLGLIAVLLIVLFGVWGPSYNAQAFIYFVF